MTRKLMVLTVAATIALVANGLNAQEVDGHLKKFDDHFVHIKNGVNFHLQHESSKECQQCPATKVSADEAVLAEQMEAFRNRMADLNPPGNHLKLTLLEDGKVINMAGQASNTIEFATPTSSITLEDGEMLIDGQIVLLHKGDFKLVSSANCNCKQCDTTKTDCENCPHCTAQAANTSTKTRVPSKLAAELTGSRCLPGSTAFMREQCQELTADRKRLAKQIADYLAKGDHTPEHMQRVLELAMESAADQAHHQAMQPAPVASKNTFYLSDDLNFKAMPATPPARSAKNTPNQREQELMQRVKQLNSDQEATRDVIVLLKKDMQRIAEDVSRLRVESNMMTRSQQTTFPTRPKQAWQSQVAPPRSSDMVRIRNQFVGTKPRATFTDQENVVDLKNRIRQLEHQLSMTSHGQNMQGVQQAALMTPTAQLLPRSSSAPLTPVAPLRTITVNYYVGDMMAPPFVSATLQLMQFLKTNIDPDSWEAHGKIEISEPSISLSITQTLENHTAVQNALGAIRSGRVTYKRKN